MVRGRGLSIGAEGALGGVGGGGVCVKLGFLLWSDRAGFRGLEGVGGMSIVMRCCLRGIGGRGEIMMVAAIRLFIQSSNPRGLFFPIRSHICIMIILASSWLLLFLLLLCLRLHFPSYSARFLRVDCPAIIIPLGISIAICNYTSSTQSSRLRGTGESRAVRPFAAEDGRFVVAPVVLAPDEAAVFRPEEEPDCDEDHGYAQQGEEREEAPVVDLVGVEGAVAGGVGS